MAGWEHVHNLMIEAGEAMDLEQVSEFAAENAWHLITRCGSVEVDYFDADDRLLLTAVAGAPEPERRNALFEELLAFNGKQPDPRGIRAGFLPSSAEVVILVEARATGLSAPTLVGLLERFCDATLHWQTRIREHEPATDRGLATPVLRG